MTPTVVPVVLLFSLAQTPPPAEPTLVTRAFPVAELVVPIPDFALPPDGPVAGRRADATTADGAAVLVRQVNTMVRPGSWAGSGGGRGTIRYTDPGHTLEVTNTPEVVAEVARFLDGLRRMQDVAVATQVHVLSGPAGFGEKLGLRTGGRADPIEAGELLAAAERVRGAVTASSFAKLTTFDGQEASVLVGERRSFVAGLDAVVTDGKVGYRPRSAMVDVGDRLTLRGRITGTGGVAVRATLTRTRVAGEPVEVTAPGGGVVGLAAETASETVGREATVADGETLVVGRLAEPNGREAWVVMTVRVVRNAD